MSYLTGLIDYFPEYTEVLLRLVMMDWRGWEF